MTGTPRHQMIKKFAKHHTILNLLTSLLACACATDEANRTSKNPSSVAVGYSGGSSNVAVVTSNGGYGGSSRVAVATSSGGYGGSGVAVGVGGYGSGVAVCAGNAGAYAGTGYGYVNNVGAVVAPVGCWYPFYYSSPLYASPVPQVCPMPQVQQTPYTYQPYYVQPVMPLTVNATAQ